MPMLVGAGGAAGAGQAGAGAAGGGMMGGGMMQMLPQLMGMMGGGEKQPMQPPQTGSLANPAAVQALLQMIQQNQSRPMQGTPGYAGGFPLGRPQGL